MHKIQEIGQLDQLLNYVQQSSQINEQEIFSLENFCSKDDPLHKFVYEKLHFLQDILCITTSALHCVIDLHEEKQQLQKNNNTLKNEFNQLCQANANLKFRIQELLDQASLQKQQIDIVYKRQQLLQIQTSIIKKELQETKSKLSENEQKLLATKSNIQQFEPIKIEVQCLQLQSKHSINQSIRDIRNQLNVLQIATNTLRKKVNQDQNNEKSIKKKNSQNSYNYLSSTIPKQLIKNKMNTYSLKTNNKHNIQGKENLGSVVRNPRKLNQQIQGFHLNHCDSEFQKDINNQNILQNEKLEQQDEMSEIYQLNQQSVYIKRSKLAQNFQKQSFVTPESSINYSRYTKKKEFEQHKYQTQTVVPEQFKYFKKKNQSLKSDISIIYKKPKKQILYGQFNEIIDKINQVKDDCFCKKLTRNVKNIHEYLFNKIVKQRIEPRRTIRRDKLRNNLNLKK